MNKLLSTLDRLTTHVGPLSTLIDHVAGWIAPKTTAAACSGYYCGTVCQGYQRQCPSKIEQWKFWSYDAEGCSAREYDCGVLIGCC